jgi:hypothetical protein
MSKPRQQRVFGLQNGKALADFRSNEENALSVKWSD